MTETKPSSTACKVALNVLALGATPQTAAVLPDGAAAATARLLRASGAASARAVRWASSPAMTSVCQVFDQLLPGQFEAFGRRKKLIETHVLEALSDGATRIVVLGAGYDTMAWRLAPQYPSVAFIEIDHPATARFKRRGIEAMGRPENYAIVAADLGQKMLRDALADASQCTDAKRTIFVAEGLLMYLRPSEVEGLLRQCRSLGAAGSVIFFTFVATDRHGRPDAGRWSPMVRWLFRAIGEPWHFSISPDLLGGWLEETGWTYRPAKELGTSFGRLGVEHFGIGCNSSAPAADG